VHRRFHFGCGPITPYGWVNCDIDRGAGVDVVADIRQGLPIAAETFDYAVSIHALPEIPFAELGIALSELRRVLKTGGVLRLGLPDLEKAIGAYLDKDIDYFMIPDDVVRTLSGKMIAQLLWYGRSRCMFTLEFITELLVGAGYRDIRSCAFRQTASPFPGIIELDDRPLESFFVEATK